MLVGHLSFSFSDNSRVESKTARQVCQAVRYRDADGTEPEVRFVIPNHDIEI